MVGVWIRRLYEMIIKGLENKSFFYSHKKAQASILFIESFCHHHEGALAPGKIKLELWQKATLSLIFGIVDEEGVRIFREVFLVVARKNGKTLFASAIAEYCAFLDGEYGGRIYFCAPKLEQAYLCFEAFHQMILQEPELDNMAKKRRTDIYIQETNTTAKALAFNASKSDGLNISLCVADECASWRGDAGLKFYEVIKSSFGARKQPLLLSISTSGYINDGIYDELMKRSTRVLKGDSKEKRLLPILYMIDDPEKWNDINELRKANPNLGVSVPVDYLIEEIAIAEGSLSKKSEFLCKYANLKQNSSQAWLDVQDVEKCCGEHLDLEQFRSSYAVVGIDLSQTVDLTAVSCAIEKEGEIYIITQFFMPSEKIEEATARDGVPYMQYVKKGVLTLSGENFVDYHDCFKWVTDLVEKYEIYPLKVGYDRYSAQYLIKDLESYGYQCDDVYQGDNLWSIIQEVGALIKSGKIHIGDNDLLKLHFLDSAIKMNNDRGRGRLIKLNPNTSHIDGMASVLDAFTMRSKYFDEIGGRLENN